MKPNHPNVLLDGYARNAISTAGRSGYGISGREKGINK